MADWRRLAKALALADGRIDEREAHIIHHELLKDHKIDRSELEFLLELRREAKEVVPSFNHFVHTVIRKVILDDGVISDHEAAWLRHWIFADGKVDPDEKQLLQDLKQGARQVSKDFQALYDECMKL
jgi:hypothetical protein